MHYSCTCLEKQRKATKDLCKPNQDGCGWTIARISSVVTASYLRVFWRNSLCASSAAATFSKERIGDNADTLSWLKLCAVSAGYLVGTDKHRPLSVGLDLPEDWDQQFEKLWYGGIHYIKMMTMILLLLLLLIIKIIIIIKIKSLQTRRDHTTWELNSEESDLQYKSPLTSATKGNSLLPNKGMGTRVGLNWLK
jgi:hypothetical protein